MSETPSKTTFNVDSFFIELEKVFINSCLVYSEMNRNKEDFLEPSLK